jgi:ribosomal-protein-alanine N-acetyltransferase
MTFHLVPMEASAAERIAEWRYDPPYDLYDLDADPGDHAEFLDPSNWADTYAVEDAAGTLVGFFEFTPGETVEIGLGMRPDHTGRGLGRAFVEAGLAFASERYGAGAFELAVASFNERALAVYETLGFERLETYSQETNGGEHEFVRMHRAADGR